MKHRYGPVAIGELSGAQPVAARTRNTLTAFTVKHYVMVHPHNGPAPTALCGRRPAHGWVLEPDVELDCRSCAKILERDSR